MHVTRTESRQSGAEVDVNGKLSVTLEQVHEARRRMGKAAA
jgi:hypothetical protein